MTFVDHNVHRFEAEDIVRWFADIYEISRDNHGVSRPAFSATESEVLNYLSRLAQSTELAISRDQGQNLIVSLEEDTDADKFVLIGSHVDSVPMGGNYDGLAGVLAGFACLIKAKTQGIRFTRPVKVIAMRGEESAWFGPCYIASRALMGTLDETELAFTHRGDGRSLADHMNDVGIDLRSIRAGQPLMDKSQILEYIELHIEQGPLLLGMNLSTAVVSGIRGNVRYKNIRCIGEAGHSGAVPRAFRRDPVLAVAHFLSRLDDSWLTILQKGDDLVLTSGIVCTDPERHALSRIAGELNFSLDVRSQSADVLTLMSNLIAEEIDSISDERGVQFYLGEKTQTPPALMDTALVNALNQATSRLGFKPKSMASGGGHDAAVFANAGVPSAMVFVRNQNGSHNPNEDMDIDDFLIGTSIIFEHLIHDKV